MEIKNEESTGQHGEQVMKGKVWIGAVDDGCDYEVLRLVRFCFAFLSLQVLCLTPLRAFKHAMMNYPVIALLYTARC